jgi:hypothetical protein
MADSLLLDMLGLRVAFDEQFQRGALIEPAFALADQAEVPASLGDEGVSCETQQHNEFS